MIPWYLPPAIVITGLLLFEQHRLPPDHPADYLPSLGAVIGDYLLTYGPWLLVILLSLKLLGPRAEQGHAKELRLARMPRNCFIKGMALGFLSIFLFLGLSVIVYTILDLPDGSDGTISLLERAPSHTRVVLILAAVVVAPIMEELAFRLVLFRAMRIRFSREASTSLVAFLFALCHQDYGAIIPLFGLGLVLQECALRSRSLYLPMLVHAHFNCWMLILTQLVV